MGVPAMTTSSVLPVPSAPSDPDRPPLEPDTREPRIDPADGAARRRLIRNGIDVAVVAMCVVFIIGPLHPDLLLTNSTPAGGDMGAHVWAPAFLRDELLPSLRLSGWTPDWYAGFPAFQFYMVVPSLMIVAVNSGVQGWLALFPFAAQLDSLEDQRIVRTMRGLQRRPEGAASERRYGGVDGTRTRDLLRDRQAF